MTRVTGMAFNQEGSLLATLSQAEGDIRQVSIIDLHTAEFETVWTSEGGSTSDDPNKAYQLHHDMTVENQKTHETMFDLSMQDQNHRQVPEKYLAASIPGPDGRTGGSLEIRGWATRHRFFITDLDYPDEILKATLQVFPGSTLLSEYRFTPDGRFLLAGFGDHLRSGSIMVWDVSDVPDTRSWDISIPETRP